MESDVSNLQGGYYALRNQYQTLQSNYNALSGQYQALQSDYNALNGEYQALEDDYDALYQEYQLSEALRIGHLLQDYYAVVRDLIQGDFLWRVVFAGAQGQVDFAANLAAHDLGHLYWVGPEADFVELSGGRHSDELARAEIEEVIAFIGIEPIDSSTVKIEKILAFINEYVHYENDMNDAFLAPVETLAFGSGDCDDYAILAAALFEYYGIDSAVGFFTSPNYSAGHVMVLVHLDNIHPYGCYYFSDLTDKGLSAGRWLIIEPQATIENQHTSWIAQ